MTNHAAPRQAVILAAGMGSRLRPLTEMRPKPLIEVHGVPILHNALRQLDRVGVRRATIVVGYRKEAIEQACGHRFGDVEVDYVPSAVFASTGSAYSLWLAREALLAGDIFLLEGDVFFEGAALRHLIGAEAANVAAVAAFDERMEGSAALLGADDVITEIRMRQSAADLPAGSAAPLFKTMNLFRFSAAALHHLIVPELDRLVGGGAQAIYTEELLAHLIADHGLRLTAVRCDADKWYEIDNEADLRIAEDIFAPAPRGALVRAAGRA